MLTPIVAHTRLACGGTSLFAPLGNGRVFQLQNLHCVILLPSGPTKFLSTELSSICFFHIDNNLSDPFWDAPLLHVLLQGIKCSVGLSSKRRLPITMTLLQKLKSELGQAHLTSFHVTNSCFGPPSHWPSSLSYVQVSLLHLPPLTSMHCHTSAPAIYPLTRMAP